MVQRGQQFDFGLLPLELVGIGGLRSEQLERDFPAQVLVPGRVHGGHTAPADHFSQAGSGRSESLS